MALAREVGYAGSFSFKYSRRPGTPASAMAGQVDEAVKTERLHRLQALLETQQRAFNAARIGQTLPVLFERPGRHPGQVIGRSPYLQGVHCDGDATLIGRIAPVRILDASLNSLTGQREAVFA